MVAYSSLSNRVISFDLATEALKDIITTSKNEEINVLRIKEKVSSVFNLKMEDFNSKKNTFNSLSKTDSYVFNARTY